MAVRDQVTEHREQDNIQIEGSTYDVLKNRLANQGKELRRRLELLNNARKEVFGSIETTLIATERINTEHNCVPSDMVPFGNTFIFGYNVHLGLKVHFELSDVFSIYGYSNHSFHHLGLDLINDPNFLDDFEKLFKFYKDTQFVRFWENTTHLYMIFRTSNSITDIKAFKWAKKGNKLVYIDNRSHHEFVFPNQYEFRWKKTNRDLHRHGKHPHISIEDKVFVETVGGHLTIKVEDNTDEGKGIYEEEVTNKDQTLDDAEIHYAIVGNLVLLKIKPFQERDFRYIVYNIKLQEAVRIDAIADSCILLPDDHGLIFANGYYLQTGEWKQFDNQLRNMLFERRVSSPNGEDFLFVFYNRLQGIYLLLPYNLISQKVENPIVCHGYSIFDNGELCYFNSEENPSKHHVVRIWQTPYTGINYQTTHENDSFIYKIGNKDIVRAMAECNALLVLIDKGEAFSDVYSEILKQATDITDSFYWINSPETHKLAEPLLSLKETASSAIEEFEKVKRIRKNTWDETERVIRQAEALLGKLQREKGKHINDFVNALSSLRVIRGEVISLKTLRYVEEDRVEKYEKELEKCTDKVSSDTVSFLLNESSLKPYQDKVENLKTLVETVSKVIDVNELNNDIEKISKELEMLIDVVSNLKIDDATQTTRIIDNISAIYSSFNTLKATLRNTKKQLMSVEGKAEFNAQIKLIGQGVINYLDICDSPDKCDEYLTKLMVQLEELEGKFSEFDEFIDTLSQKREEIYEAFESKKVSLVEERNRRANILLGSADRIIKAVQSRIGRFGTVTEINGFYASDLLIEKARNIVKELTELGDTVKSDDIESRLKMTREEAARQLKDKSELFVEGQNIIRFGKHQFSVNTQPLELSIIYRNGDMFYHLSGTNFFEKVTDPLFLESREVWGQVIISENRSVYRAEYLSYKIIKSALSHNPNGKNVDDLYKMTDQELTDHVQRYMSTRYNEGYVKGVHDHDASAILKAALKVIKTADLLKYPSSARACAKLYWCSFIDEKKRTLLNHQLKGVGLILKAFPFSKEYEAVIADLEKEIEIFVSNTNIFDTGTVKEAATYLFYELTRGDEFIIDKEASALFEMFHKRLKDNKFTKEFEGSVEVLTDDKVAKYRLIRKWLRAFMLEDKLNDKFHYIDEVSVLLFLNDFNSQRIINIQLKENIQGLHGSHNVIDNKNYHFDYHDFMKRLAHFEGAVVPEYEKYTALKKSLTDKFSEELRLNEFKPRVMSSFVRNKLIDEVYLPLIGANLAKQIGTTGENKRTDLMGMLLLISPPGYGKTTLMEYIANRLGIIFMKINGPAIGHEVTSVDPASAPNSAARDELEKLNLSFEMGDNVMIYLDDIQHCNPEFLQKFISLCDAQRKIEGVYKGRSKTYDFRGKKVCVVMAGNPYTESGDKFKIPDMLANRADIYNLGDIIGDTAEVFKLSYIENAITSNPILNKLAGRSQKDVHALVKIAETGSREGAEFEVDYSIEEINEYVNVLQKMIIIRDIILKVNLEYIRSAAQADEFRTEPLFKLQGSYRNMNKITEKIVPVMNNQELSVLINSHYEGESQTLTTGAEANMLKYKELTAQLDKTSENRWKEIKQIFLKNQKMKGFGANEQVGQVLIQMENIGLGLEGIRKTLESNSDLLKTVKQ